MKIEQDGRRSKVSRVSTPPWREWLPLALLLLGLSTTYVFSQDWGYFAARHLSSHDSMSAMDLAIAENLSPSHNFLLFQRLYPGEDGEPAYQMYSRFPVGGYALIKLAILPFGDDLSAKLHAGRVLMLLLFGGAAVLAYLSLLRIASNRWVALAATLLAFSSYPLLFWNDVIGTEGMIDIFSTMLVFHGMVVFHTEGRFGQLLVKTGAGLALGWQVYALLLPFIALGLGGELVRASRGGALPLGNAHRIRHVAVALPRSRYFTLGAAALLIGLCLLIFNFANEYAALKADSIAELPSFKSMMRRIGLDPVDSDLLAPELVWANFLSEQLQRIGRVTIPYALSVHTDGLGWLHPGGRLSLPYEIIGLGALAACLLGALLARRHGMLFAVLSLGGLCWAIPMRNTTGIHKYYEIFYVGIPLTLFSLILMALSSLILNRLQGQGAGRVAAGAAVAALIVFALSSYQMGRTDDQSTQPQTALMDDFRTIRGITRGKSVYVPTLEIAPYTFYGDESIWMLLDNVALWSVDRLLEYALAGSIIQQKNTVVTACGSECGNDYDYVISAERHDVPALLTPENRLVFLYDAAGAVDLYQSQYREIASRIPLVRSEFDIYLDDDRLVYLKEPCVAEDPAARFFVHLFPKDESGLSADSRLHGSSFNNLDFASQNSVIWNGRCLNVVPLPDYEIARVRTGQFVRIEGKPRKLWKAEFDLASARNHSSRNTD